MLQAIAETPDGILLTIDGIEIYASAVTVDAITAAEIAQVERMYPSALAGLPAGQQEEVE